MFLRLLAVGDGARSRLRSFAVLFVILIGVWRRSEYRHFPQSGTEREEGETGSLESGIAVYETLG